jgi:hypothetical protein
MDKSGNNCELTRELEIGITGFIYLYVLTYRYSKIQLKDKGLWIRIDKDAGKVLK